MTDTDQQSAFSQLPPRRQTFVKAYLANGGKGKAAAIEAGYSEHSAKSQAWQLLHKDELVKEALKEHADGIQQDARYDAHVAMRELEDVMHFSKKTNNATALARAVELRMRMAGLLIERAIIGTQELPSIKEAMAEAHRRIGRPVPSNLQPSYDKLTAIPHKPQTTIEDELADILDMGDSNESETANPQTTTEVQK